MTKTGVMTINGNGNGWRSYALKTAGAALGILLTLVLGLGTYVGSSAIGKLNEHDSALARVSILDERLAAMKAELSELRALLQSNAQRMDDLLSTMLLLADAQSRHRASVARMNRDIATAIFDQQNLLLKMGVQPTRPVAPPDSEDPP